MVRDDAFDPVQEGDVPVRAKKGSAYVAVFCQDHKDIFYKWKAFFIKRAYGMSFDQFFDIVHKPVFNLFHHIVNI